MSRHKSIPLLCIFIAIILITSTSCGSYRFVYKNDASVKSLLTNQSPVYPNTKFYVIADPHLYNPQLGTKGYLFRSYSSNHNKMLSQTEELLNEVISDIATNNADFVIICGDLTKDGELASHELFASNITKIIASDKTVYIIPGNHDINNNKSFRYTKNNKLPTPSISSNKFAEIYINSGYGNALYRDPNSLSYIVEPVQGLWLFGMDSCRYRENKKNKYPITGGKFYKQTLAWIEAMLILARKQNKAVIGIAHHSIIEHYKGQKKYMPNYIIDNYKEISRMFAFYGMKVIFTGHHHAQDITVNNWQNNNKILNLYDVETGSLAMPPFPYREVSISNNTMSIKTKKIYSIPSIPNDLQKYGENFIYLSSVRVVNYYLKIALISKKSSAIVAPQLVKSFVTHVKGDEKKPEKVLDMKGVGLWARFVVLFRKKMAESFYTDLPPADNNVIIELSVK